MKCNCCGKRRGLLESFENINNELDVCVKCSNLLYNLKDMYNLNNEKEYERILKTINEINKHESIFDEWLKNYIKGFEK